LTLCGQIVAGQVGSILIREKSGEKIELGDLLVVDDAEGYLIIQVYDLLYGSQISRLSREQLSGLKLEGLGAGLEFFEPQLRNYIIAQGKAVLRVSSKTQSPKVLPDFFGTVRHVEAKDLQFLSKPKNPIYLGEARSGSKVIKVPVYLDANEALVHHVLIASTTGRGKSNLVKVMLWSILGQEKFGILVLDAHDEYYGRAAKGLKDHPKAKGNLLYYSVNPVPGTATLTISLGSISPEHLEGIVSLTEAQEQAVRLYHSKFEGAWIENILRGTQVDGVKEVTLAVLQRIIRTKLSTYLKDGEIVSKNRVFSDAAGKSTVRSIVGALEEGKVVVIDTSKIGDEAELLIGSMVANEVFARYQDFKAEGALDDKLPVSIIIEEAPRVLGSDKLAFGDNIYSKIAKEGRKFKVGLQAITQLTSVIPRDILTNINTKIILGNEMATERRAIIDSAAQDLADDDRTIASLDKGEAIVTSIFTKFAVPIQIPLFDDLVNEQKASPQRLQYSG
jgi:DNA helicase HerA-like ATPase